MREYPGERQNKVNNTVWHGKMAIGHDKKGMGLKMGVVIQMMNSPSFQRFNVYEGKKGGRRGEGVGRTLDWSTLANPLAGSLLCPGWTLPEMTVYGVPATWAPPILENALALPSPVAALRASNSSCNLRCLFSCLVFEIVLPWKLQT